MEDYSQASAARNMYDARAETYNDSHHPAFASYFVTHLAPQPGWHILDLASGTGLVALEAARAVGPTGSVLGIDISAGMQAVATAELSRLRADEGVERWAHVQFCTHDITRLHELPILQGRTFDAITCCSALVLLKAPLLAVRSWLGFLRPGGCLLVDATHPRNLVAGMALEAVGARLRLPVPYFRMWSQSEEDLAGLLRAAGLRVEGVHHQRQTAHSGKEYTVEDGESIWDDLSQKEPARFLRAHHDQAQVKRFFLEEWKLMADKDGRIHEVDGVFVGKATKVNDNPPPDPLMTGSCACGAVTWTAAAFPDAICHCLCTPCRKLSGAPFLTMMDLPAWSLAFTPAYASLKSIALTPHARRAFCGACGATLTFQHFRNLHRLEVAMGSLDEESLAPGSSARALVGGAERRNWCWMRSKVGWFELPEDGWERMETMTSCDAISAYADDA